MSQSLIKKNNNHIYDFVVLGADGMQGRIKVLSPRLRARG